jgi:hypothetical protein
MMSTPLIPVNIVIGDRSYRIKIESGDEAHIRKTIKVINEKVVEYKTHFAGQDMQDYVAMVLIWYATQITEGAPAPVADSELLGGLALLEEQLDKALSPGTAS